MKTLWARQSWLDYINWQHVERETAAKINDLVADVVGLGKPEALKGRLLQGWWSRRITKPNRLVYRVFGKGDQQTVEILYCRGHHER
jgi:toxin YoeB